MRFPEHGLVLRRAGALVAESGNSFTGLPTPRRAARPGGRAARSELWLPVGRPARTSGPCGQSHPDGGHRRPRRRASREELSTAGSCARRGPTSRWWSSCQACPVVGAAAHGPAWCGCLRCAGAPVCRHRRAECRARRWSGRGGPWSVSLAADLGGRNVPGEGVRPRPCSWRRCGPCERSVLTLGEPPTAAQADGQSGGRWAWRPACWRIPHLEHRHAAVRSGRGRGTSGGSGPAKMLGPAPEAAAIPDLLWIPSGWAHLPHEPGRLRPIEVGQQAHAVHTSGVRAVQGISDRGMCARLVCPIRSSAKDQRTTGAGKAYSIRFQ